MAFVTQVLRNDVGATLPDLREHFGQRRVLVQTLHEGLRVPMQ